MKDLISPLKRNKAPIIGIGVTAFNRIGPAFFLNNFEIICYKNGSDLPSLEKFCKIISIQRDLRGENLERLNSLALLKHRGVFHYLKSKKGIKIFVYRSTERIDKICEENGWQLLANKARIRDVYEDKKRFRQIGKKAKIGLIEGETLRIDNLDRDQLRQFQKKYGPNLVFQLTDISRGGGLGTFFINQAQDFENFCQFVRKERRERELKNVNVTKRIQGIPASITGCVTHSGVICSPIQTQIIDQPEVMGPTKSKGRFCGHDWQFRHYQGRLQNQAERIARRLGEYMGGQGYKGIFGIDLIIDEREGRVHPVECNPRYTGAFPVYTMLQLQAEEIPFEAFHLLEFLGIPYEVDVEAINRSYQSKKRGSHLVLYNRDRKNWVKAWGNLQAGVYRLENGKLKFLREGFSVFDIKNQSEFVLTDGVPKKGDLVKPGLRCGKLIFNKSILGSKGRLTPEVKEIIRLVYKSLDLRKTKFKQI